jgi:asparagine synthase (glutamine-hydrolysing)
MGEFSRERMEVSLRPMLDAQVHRGPDDRGMTLLRAGDSAMALAHTRLAILDLSSAGHQPMGMGEIRNSDFEIRNETPSARYWITYNGEIYNYRELREQLGPEVGGQRSEVGGQREKRDET